LAAVSASDGRFGKSLPGKTPPLPADGQVIRNVLGEDQTEGKHRRLAKEDPRKARVVELRFFGGLSVEETGEVLGTSVQTVRRDWNFAQAWLLRAMRPVASERSR
jgi:DNA-directed RNA polymerase specialized sigma24 family protein